MSHPARAAVRGVGRSHRGHAVGLTAVMAASAVGTGLDLDGGDVAHLNTP